MAIRDLQKRKFLKNAAVFGVVGGLNSRLARITPRRTLRAYLMFEILGQKATVKIPILSQYKMP